ncbi:MAG: O-methyltransferase [Clostridiaceae bacterium]|nr:O-methyltransferase [Clostridiaceae bacterium]
MIGYNNNYYDYVIKYIRETLPQTRGILKEMEEYAAYNHVPIVHPEVARLILVLCKMLRPKSILEIGTAIGYSSILMSEALEAGGKIVTIERYRKMVELARENIKKAGLEDTVEVLEGEAVDILPALKGSFDFIFMDAAKGQYLDFLPYCMDLLREGGVLVSDNVLYKGMVATDTMVVRRKKTLVNRLRDYLYIICHHPLLESTIIPIGDGVAISYKVNNKDMR